MLPLSVPSAQITLYCSAIRRPGHGAAPPSWQFPALGLGDVTAMLRSHWSATASLGLSLVRTCGRPGPARVPGFLCTHFGGGWWGGSRCVLLPWQVWWENDVNWRGTDVYDGSCLLAAPVSLVSALPVLVPPGLVTTSQMPPPPHLSSPSTIRPGSRSVLILAEIWLNMNKICSGRHQAAITPRARDREHQTQGWSKSNRIKPKKWLNNSKTWERKSRM